MASKIYKPSEQEKKVLADSYKDFNNARDQREHVDKNWEAFEKQWEGYYADELEDADRSSSSEYRSNVWVPMTYWLTMTAMTEIVQQDPTLTMLPSSKEDEVFAKIMEEIAAATLDKGNFLIEWYKLCMNAGIFGTGFLYEYYRCDSRVIKELSEYDPKTNKFEYTKKKISEYEDVYAESFSPYHAYPDPKATSMDNCRYFFRRFIHGENDFKAKYKDKFKNVDYVKGAGRSLDENVDWEWWDTTGLNYLEDDQIETLWGWDKVEDRMVVMANGVLLTEPDMPIPYKHKQIPIISMPWVMRPNRFWGKGMCEMLEKLQYERNVSRNLALDQARLNILKVFFVNAEEGITPDQLQLKPGLAISVKGDPRNAVYPLEYSDLKSSYFKLDEMTDQDSVRATGIAPELTGVSKAETATQASIMKEATLKRMQLQILMYYKDSLTRFGRLRVHNIQQFYKDPIKVEAVVGEDDTEYYVRQYREIRMKNKALGYDGENVTMQRNPEIDEEYSYFQTIPELLMNEKTGEYYNFDIKVNIESGIKVSKALQQEKERDLFELMRDDPTIDQTKLKEGYLKSLDKTPEDYIVEQPMMPPGMEGMPPGASPMGGPPPPGAQQGPGGAPAMQDVMPGMGGQ